MAVKIKRIVYCANMSGYAPQVLNLFETMGIDIVGVFVMADDYYQKNKVFFDRMLQRGLACDLKNYLDQKHYQVNIIGNINSLDTIGILDEAKPDIIVNNGMMFIYKEEILRKYRVLNTHSGYLPFYRGRCGASWAIYNGQTKYGLSCHLVDEDVDTGPIVVQKMIEIKKTDYIYDLLLREQSEFPILIKDAISKLNNPSFIPKKQNKHEGSFFPVLQSERDGIIDWRTETTEKIYNKIRAFSFPYAGAFTIKDGVKYIISRARYDEPNEFVCSEPGLVFAETEDGGVRVSTIDGQIIIEKIMMNEEEIDAVHVWKSGTWVFSNILKEAAINITGSVRI
jgi:methionyl-tRNA formyltransferase